MRPEIYIVLGRYPGAQLEEVRLSAEDREGNLIVAVGGELDVVTSRRFDEYLTAARREHDRVILDLSEVDFLDTSALAVIIGHWKKLAAAGGTLVLAGARYRYTKTLWITGLADRLPMFETAAQAVEAARPGNAVADGPRR